MKKLLTLLMAALLAVVPITAQATDATFQSVFSSYNTGDATGPAATYLAFGGTVDFKGQIPIVRTISATSDLAGSAVTVYEENGDSTTTDAAYSSGAKILPVTATTSFQDTTAGEGSWIAIIDYVNKKFEVNRVSSITAGVSLNLVRNTANTYASGTKVKELASMGTIPVGNATITWDNTFLTGRSGEVMAWSVNGTSACSLNYVAGDYRAAQGQ